MNETVLEEMIVRLLGDGSSYVQMMQQAQTSSQQTAKVVQEQTKIIEQMQQSLTGFGTTAMSVLSGLGASKFLSKAFNSYKEAETGALRLNAAIEANGQTVGDVMPQFQAFAAQMREQTGAGKGEVMGLLQRAESYGLSADGAMRATRAALALAASQGGSAEHFLQVGRAIEENNPHMIHHIAALRGIHDPQEKLIKAQKMIEDGMKVAGTVMNSTEGVMKKLSATAGLMLKQFGQITTEALIPIVKVLTQVYEKFNSLDPAVKRAIVYGAMLVAGILMVGPAIATITQYAAPVASILTRGFSVIRSAIVLLLSPIQLLKIALSALSATWTMAFTPIGLVIGIAAVAIAVLIQKFGGIEPAMKYVSQKVGIACERIKKTAIEAWEIIKTKVQQFIEWIKPALEEAGTIIQFLWFAVGKGVLTVWDFVQDAYSGLVGWISTATQWTIEFVKANQQELIVLGSTVAAILAIWGAYKLLISAKALLMGLITLLGIKQILQAIAWVGIKVVILAATAAMHLYNIAAIAGIAFTGVIAAAFVALGLAVYAAYHAIREVLDALYQIPTTSGPLAEVGQIFYEWFGIIKDIIRAAKIDMPLAWEIMKSGFSLAVEQVKGIWPPLWAFIQEGFLALWELATTVFKQKFKEALRSIIPTMSEVGSWIGRILGTRNREREDADRILREMQSRQDELEMIRLTQNAQRRLQLAVEAFHYEETLEATQARNRLRGAQAYLNFLESLPEPTAAAQSAAENAGLELGKSANKGLNKELHKLDAALFNSAETLGRIAAYKERIAGTAGPENSMASQIAAALRTNQAPGGAYSDRPGYMTMEEFLIRFDRYMAKWTNVIQELPSNPAGAPWWNRALEFIQQSPANPPATIPMLSADATENQRQARFLAGLMAPSTQAQLQQYHMGYMTQQRERYRYLVEMGLMSREEADAQFNRMSDLVRQRLMDLLQEVQTGDITVGNQNSMDVLVDLLTRIEQNTNNPIQVVPS